MILYLDTSSLSKLYLVEEGSDTVQGAVRRAARLVASRVAYAETRVALARAWRDGRINDPDFVAAKAEFERSWGTVVVVEVTDGVVRLAGDFGDKYSIRGFDAVHLASAWHTRAGATGEVYFSTADGRLRDAAAAEGFALAL